MPVTDVTGREHIQLISAADVAMYGRKRMPSLAAGSLPDVGDVPPGPLRTLIVAVQQKDGFVGDHSERAAHWAVRIAVALGLSEHERQVLRIAGLVHDIGKIGVPERILNKPGSLSIEERRQVEHHVEVGVQLIDEVPYQEQVIAAVAHHHERWDGLGYPRGLQGEDIPLSGRILALADAYSAMTTDRAYRARVSPMEAVERIRAQSGAQFDPHIVRVFLTLVEPSGAIVISERNPQLTDTQSLRA